MLHQEVGEGTVAHLGQVALQVTTHARHEVVAEVAGGTLGVLLTHHHCLEGEDVVVGQRSKNLHLHLAEMCLQNEVTNCFSCNKPGMQLQVIHCTSTWCRLIHRHETLLTYAENGVHYKLECVHLDNL